MVKLPPRIEIIISVCLQRTGERKSRRIPQEVPERATGLKPTWVFFALLRVEDRKRKGMAHRVRTVSFFSWVSFYLIIIRYRQHIRRRQAIA